MARRARLSAFHLPPPPREARGRHVARHLIELPRLFQCCKRRRPSRRRAAKGIGVERERPLGGARPDIADASFTIAGMPSKPVRIVIPRWAQLVLLPLLLLLLWTVAGAVRHVVFLFLVAALVALLLNPIVRGLTRLRLPRGLGVAIVYLAFAALVAAVAIAIGTLVVNQTKSASHRVDTYFTETHGQGQTHAE